MACLKVLNLLTVHTFLTLSLSLSLQPFDYSTVHMFRSHTLCLVLHFFVSTVAACCRRLLLVSGHVARMRLHLIRLMRLHSDAFASWRGDVESRHIQAMTKVKVTKEHPATIALSRLRISTVKSLSPNLTDY